MDCLFRTAPEQTSGESQFQMYLAEPQLSHNIHPFEWWAMRASRHPALVKLAKKFHCMPASSVRLERVFYTARNIVSPKQSCSFPVNVNLLIFYTKTGIDCEVYIVIFSSRYACFDRTVVFFIVLQYNTIQYKITIHRLVFIISKNKM